MKRLTEIEETSHGSCSVQEYLTRIICWYFERIIQFVQESWEEDLMIRKRRKLNQILISIASENYQVQFLFLVTNFLSLYKSVKIVTTLRSLNGFSYVSNAEFIPSWAFFRSPLEVNARAVSVLFDLISILNGWQSSRSITAINYLQHSYSVLATILRIRHIVIL